MEELLKELTHSRNVERMLKYLVLANMINDGLTQEEANKKLEKLLS